MSSSRPASACATNSSRSGAKRRAMGSAVAIPGDSAKACRMSAAVPCRTGSSSRQRFNLSCRAHARPLMGATASASDSAPGKVRAPSVRSIGHPDRAPRIDLAKGLQ